MLLNERVIATGRILTEHAVAEYMRSAALNIDEELSRFVDNTLAYAQQEKALILGRICFPRLKASLQGKPVVVVVRGLATTKTRNPLVLYTGGEADFDRCGRRR